MINGKIKLGTILRDSVQTIEKVPDLEVIALVDNAVALKYIMAKGTFGPVTWYDIRDLVQLDYIIVNPEPEEKGGK